MFESAADIMNISCVWVCVCTEWQPNRGDDLWMTLLSCLLNHTCLLTHLQHCLVMQQDDTHTHTGKAWEGPIILRREKVNPPPTEKFTHTQSALRGLCVWPGLSVVIHYSSGRSKDAQQELWGPWQEAVCPHYWQVISHSLLTRNRSHGSKETHAHTHSFKPPNPKRVLIQSTQSLANIPHGCVSWTSVCISLVCMRICVYVFSYGCAPDCVFCLSKQWPFQCVSERPPCCIGGINYSLPSHCHSL